MECKDKHEKIMFYFSIAALVLGCWLRLAGFAYGSLEYDEIWTLTHYVPGPWGNIFTDLATPNNHPLHSLLAKLSLSIFGQEIWALRLPALLAGCALIPVVWYTVYKIKPCRGAEFTAIVWTAFYGYSLYYSQAARGYSMQMLFAALIFFALWNLYKKPDSKKFALLLTASAICCCFTITSGLIYVCALAGAFALCYLLQKEDNKYQLFHKKYRYFWFAGGTFILFAALWYGLNFSKIQQGQQFGTAIDSVSSLCKFVYLTAKDIFIYPMLLICIAGACIKNPMRRLACSGLVFFALIILSAIVTKAGPPRVYLGVYPVLTIIAVSVLSALIEERCKAPQLRMLLYLLCVLPAAFVFQREWERVTPPDWGTISSEIRKEVSKDILTLYTPPDSYPVRYNDPKTVYDQIARINQVNIRGILSINSWALTGFHHLTGATEHIGAKYVSPIQAIKLSNNVTGFYYQLEPVTENSQTYHQPLLLVIRNIPEENYRLLWNILNAGSDKKWLTLNLWLFEKQEDKVNNINYVNRVYGLDEAQYDAAHYLEITRRSNGHFRFYMLKK